jgi:hypothetical protein
MPWPCKEAEMRVTGLLIALLLAGCCKEQRPSSNEPLLAEPVVANTSVAAEPTPTWNEPSVKTVVDHCSDAKVVLAVITDKVYSGPGFEWKWARQVMLANPQFTVVPHAALMPGQVAFQDYDYGTNGAKALVAVCGHGGTCNQVAQAYKKIVRSSKPTVYCGTVPGLGREANGVPMWLDGGPKANLPAHNDAISQCARLAACAILKDPSIPGDPGLECQRAPSGFKLACASKPTCAMVNDCAGR